MIGERVASATPLANASTEDQLIDPVDELVRRNDFESAVEVLERGQDRASVLPLADELRRELAEQLAAARKALTGQRRLQTARELHDLAERIRFAAVLDPLPVEQARYLAERCRALWEMRHRILEGSEEETTGGEEGLKTDLLDTAVIGAGLRERLASGVGAAEARRDALRLLDEAELLFGPSAWLDRERARYRLALGLSEEAATERRPRTAWEHVALGRHRLQAGEVQRAHEEFVRAVELNPGSFWAHFSRGLCAYRLERHDEAEQAFGVCVALSPRTAACYHNRALARTALGRHEEAEGDYTRALEQDAHLAAAALNRGLLRAQAGRHADARRDYQTALEKGADPATTHYYLALSALAEKDLTAARTSLKRVLEYNPTHSEAKGLLERLGLRP